MRVELKKPLNTTALPLLCKKYGYLLGALKLVMTDWQQDKMQLNMTEILIITLT